MATDVDKSKEVTNLEEVPKPEEVTKSEKKGNAYWYTKVPWPFSNNI